MLSAGITAFIFLSDIFYEAGIKVFMVCIHKVAGQIASGQEVRCLDEPYCCLLASGYGDEREADVSVEYTSLTLQLAIREVTLVSQELTYSITLRAC
jgi:hypothetical protein